MTTLVFPTKGMNKLMTKARKIFSYKRFRLTICGVLLVTQFAASRVQAAPTVLYTALGDSIGFGLFAPIGDGYVPTYDYYRCCNDPDGDRSFSDLLCQPFRDARDATEQFLQRIDFLRGDRVAFVTFDRRAFLVTVEVDPAENIWSHMIDNEALAINTLRDSIGVRAEPSFYKPTILPDGTVFGIISSTTDPFCSSCDRSRLTADGMWYRCLYATTGTDLRSPLRSGASQDDLLKLITGEWTARADRGAEERLATRDRSPLVPASSLKKNPHLEMHTRGG